MDRPKQLRLLGTYRIAIEGDRWLHANHGEQLEQMVWHHVAQCTGPLIKAPPSLDTDGLGGGDLHVIDMIASPERLEDAIGEAQYQDVLHRLLAEEVVDSIDLVLRQHLEDLRVESLSRCKVMPE